MSMIRDLSLKLKLPIYLSAVLATVIVMLSAIAYREVRRAQIGAAHERLQRVTRQLGDLVAAGFENRLADFEGLRADTTLHAALRGGGSLSSLSVLLDPDSLPGGVAAVEVRDPTGARIFFAGDSTRVGMAVASTPGPRGSIGALETVAAGRAYAAWTGLYDGDEALGTVTFWRPVQTDSTGLRAIQELIGQDADFYFGSAGGLWTDLADDVAPPPVDLIDDPPELGELLRYEREDGVRMYAVVEALTPGPWWVAVELEEETVLAGAHAFLIRLLVLMPLAFLVVALPAWFMGRAVTRSVRESAEAAEAIAAGQTGRRVAVRSRDEVGRLAESFNTMAQRIEDSQSALHEVNESLWKMLDGAPLPIVVLDRENRVRLWNQAAVETFGWTSEEVSGRPSPLVGADGRPIFGRPSQSEPGDEEYRTVTRSGRAIELFVASSPTYGPDGRVDGRMLVCEDITARKRAEEQLARYADDLYRSNAELENFAYIASHDLREPLRMVRSFTQLLADRYSGQLDEDADKYIHFAVDGATRMEGLIKALLEYSRLDGVAAEPTPVASGEIVERVLAILDPLIDEAGATVTFDTMPTVYGDPDQLLRVFQNLIGNALKFRRDEPARVHVSTYRDGDQQVFSVADNGIGIDPEYFDRIFVIFKRLHGPGEFGGTGMGLAICKKIIERHGGRLWVESEVGAGSTFYFSLPDAEAMVA